MPGGQRGEVCGRGCIWLEWLLQELLVGIKSEQRMWGKREPLEERKRMGASSEVRIVMQVFQVAM